jgi:chorismate mutase
MKKTVKQLRRKIDRVDDKLVRLLDKRMGLALRIAIKKRKEGLPVFDADREEKLIRRLLKTRRIFLGDWHLNAIFDTVLAESRRLQQQVIGKS